MSIFSGVTLSGVTVSPPSLSFTKTADADVDISIKLSLPAGHEITVSWGDNNWTTITGAVSETAYAHTYASAAETYQISIVGDVTAITYFKIEEDPLSCDLAQFSRLATLTHLFLYNDTITGDLANLPSGLTYFTCAGSNTISGDLTNLPSGLTYFTCAGSNTISDYSGKTWTTKPTTFNLQPVSGGLSTTEMDQLLIDFDDDLLWAAGNAITLTGTNDKRSSDSDAAKASILGEGADVTVNE